MKAAAAAGDDLLRMCGSLITKTLSLSSSLLAVCTQYLMFFSFLLYVKVGQYTENHSLTCFSFVFIRLTFSRF